jgi:cell division protein FtsI (penicillin-binding protein 3)
MRLKVKVIFILCLLCLAVIAIKLFLIQVTHAEYYQAIARRQYESKVTIAADRGNMYDCKRRLVATTVEKLSIAVDPKMLEHPEYVCRVLASVTGKSPQEYMNKIAAAKKSFVWLERTLDTPASVLSSTLDSLEDNGLIKVWEPRRSFAYGSLAAQVLGFTDSENKGASGIELAWDSVLTGKAGYMFLQRDGRGKKRRSPDLPSAEPTTGKSLILTLDMDMQTIVESELQQGVQSAAAESGVAIAIRPSTGEILAMASIPTFDPNQLTGATADLTRNRSFTDMYEPGSTFKLITAAALLDERRIRPDDIVSGASDQLPRGVAPLIHDEHPFQSAPFYRAIELSSNIVMAALSQRIPSPKFYKYVRDFGFGIYSDVDIPGEVRGIVKKPHEFDATTKLYMAHGYQLAATPLQIVNAYATVANRGVMMRPYIVRRIVDTDGSDIQVFEPQKVRRVITEQTASILARILSGVVERGTGALAKIKGMSIAGKTGTAQKLRDGKYSKEDYTASFAGFFPAENPEVALLVMLHSPRNGIYGGQVAAPIFQKIAQKLVSSGLVSPGTGEFAQYAAARATDGTTPLPPQSLLLTQEKPVVPDFRGLPYSDALEVARNLGIKLKANIAGGVVQDQKPKVGTLVKSGMEIRITTTQPDITVDVLPNTTIPNVRGMTLRRALTLLHAANIKTSVVGQGSVVARQEFKDGREPLCILYCPAQQSEPVAPTAKPEEPKSAAKSAAKSEVHQTKQGQKNP